MGHQVFEWVVAIAVLVVFITNMIILALTYKMLKPLIAKLQATNDRINPIINEVQGIMSENRDKISAVVAQSQPIANSIATTIDQVQGIITDNRPKVAAIVSDAQPVVRDIATKTNDIAGVVHGILNQAHGIISDNRENINATISESKPLVKDITIKTNDIAATVHGILGEVQGIVSENRPKVSAIISEAQPVVHDIGTKANDITGAARDMVLTVRNQVERLDNIVKGVSDKVDETASIVQSRVIEPVATKANDITDLARAQVVEIGALVRDTALILKNQAERLDELVRRTTDKIDSTTTTMQKQVTDPVREINHIGVAIKRAISTLFDRNSKTVS
jgi:ABC-type transporter Mla subunit MlaD